MKEEACKSLMYRIIRVDARTGAEKVGWMQRDSSKSNCRWSFDKKCRNRKVCEKDLHVTLKVKLLALQELTQAVKNRSKMISGEIHAVCYILIDWSPDILKYSSRLLTPWFLYCLLEVIILAGYSRVWSWNPF